MRTAIYATAVLALLSAPACRSQELMVPTAMAHGGGTYFFAYSDSSIWRSGAPLSEIACAGRGQAIRCMESSGLYGVIAFALYDDSQMWSIGESPSCAANANLSRTDDPTVKPIAIAADSGTHYMVAYEDGQIWYRGAGVPFRRLPSLERAVPIAVVCGDVFYFAYKDGTVWWSTGPAYGFDPILQEVACANRGVAIRRMEQAGPNVLALYDDNQVWFIDGEDDCFLAATLTRADQPAWKPVEMAAATGLPRLLVAYQDGQIWSYENAGPFQRVTAMERPTQPTATARATWGSVRGSFRR
jgi:hypothetical protein